MGVWNAQWKKGNMMASVSKRRMEYLSYDSTRNLFLLKEKTPFDHRVDVILLRISNSKFTIQCTPAYTVKREKTISMVYSRLTIVGVRSIDES